MRYVCDFGLGRAYEPGTSEGRKATRGGGKQLMLSKQMFAGPSRDNGTQKKLRSKVLSATPSSD